MQNYIIILSSVPLLFLPFSVLSQSSTLPQSNVMAEIAHEYHSVRAERVLDDDMSTESPSLKGATLHKQYTEACTAL